MKHQALFSSKIKVKHKSVVCCNFAWLFKVKGNVKSTVDKLTECNIYDKIRQLKAAKNVLIV